VHQDFRDVFSAFDAAEGGYLELRIVALSVSALPAHTRTPPGRRAMRGNAFVSGPSKVVNGTLSRSTNSTNTVSTSTVS
jgi:hypothetical protein